MKTLIKRASPIAIAVGLALGSASTLAQEADEPRSQQGVAQPRPGQPGQAQPGQPGQPQQGQAQPRAGQPGQAQPGQAQRGSQADDEPGSQTPARSAQAEPEAGAGAGIDQLAEENAELSKFVDAIKSTGLDDALTGGTEYTVFAPTNEALDNADIDSLMQPENRSQLVALLRAHIVADDVDQELAGQISEAQTIDGGSVEIAAEDDGSIMVGGNKATEAGIDLGNLRVYAVDEVLSEGRAQVDTQASLRRDESPGQNQAQGQNPQGQGQQRPN